MDWKKEKSLNWSRDRYEKNVTNPHTHICMHVHLHTHTHSDTEGKKLISTTRLSGRNKAKYIVITININGLTSPVTMTKNLK